MKALVWIVVLVTSFWSTAHAQLTVTDVSPNMSYASPLPGRNLSDTGGRVNALVIDPTNNNNLWAATEVSGVWKSTDAGKSWHQSGKGIRNPITLDYRNTQLAFTAEPTARLLFATSLRDGRTDHPWGGLWVSTDGADSWRHAELQPGDQPTGGLCPAYTGSGDLSSVAFDSLVAFVATPCGLLSNADPGLANGKWNALQNLPFNSSGAIIAPNSSGFVLFVCNGGMVYRSPNLGQQPSSWSSLSLGEGTSCAGLSVVPDKQSPPATVAVVYRTPTGAKTDVAIVDFNASTVKSLGLASQPLVSAGSGTPAVFAVARPDGGGSTAAGVGYDVYAADDCAWWVYAVAAPKAKQRKPEWQPLEPPSQSCPVVALHSDTWSMAFASNYNPSAGVCTAYASTDGGVFLNTSKAAARSGGCLITTGWVTAMSGLHSFRSYTMAGLSQTTCSSKYNPCPILYVPSGDNDVWTSDDGGHTWAQFDTANDLGDAGEVHVDPALPSHVLATRGLNYNLAIGSNGKAPKAGNTLTAITPANVSAGSAPGNPNCTQVLSLPGEKPKMALYAAVVSPPEAPDRIMQNNNSSPSSSNWSTLEAAGISFKNGQVQQLRSTGGLDHPVFWVLTSLGQVYRGEVKNGVIPSWKPVGTGIVNAEAIFADPWDSKILYVSDLGNPTATPPVAPSIKSTPDGGLSWVVEDTLFKIATNQGEFQPFSCALGNVSTDCYPLVTAVFFDRTNSNIRIAALYPGGIAFSSDAGNHWVPLNVTNNVVTSNPQNPIALPTSLFFDDTLNPDTQQPSLYVGLRSRGVIRVDGVFPDTSTTQAPPQLCAGQGEAVMWCERLQRCLTPEQYSSLCTVQSAKPPH